MKILFSICLIVFFCTPSVPPKTEESVQGKVREENWIVTPATGLFLRESPTQTAKSLLLLQRGTMMSHKSIPENEKDGSIDEQKGKWLKVEVGNESGWVFDVYLSKPVFSPSGDKFYFYTIKDPKTGNVVKTEYKNCGFLNIFEMQYDCSIEIRNMNN